MGWSSPWDGHIFPYCCAWLPQPWHTVKHSPSNPQGYNLHGRCCCWLLGCCGLPCLYCQPKAGGAPVSCRPFARLQSSWGQAPALRLTQPSSRGTLGCWGHLHSHHQLETYSPGIKFSWGSPSPLIEWLFSRKLPSYKLCLCHELRAIVWAAFTC